MAQMRKMIRYESLAESVGAANAAAAGARAAGQAARDAALPLAAEREAAEQAMRGAQAAQSIAESKASDAAAAAQDARDATEASRAHIERADNPHGTTAAQVGAVPRGVVVELGPDEAAAIEINRTAGTTNGKYNLILSDTASNAGRLLRIKHRGAADAQAYGIDLSNYPGAKSAIVVHQYSGSQPAVVIDNTAGAPILRLRNTENPNESPGTQGSGDYLDLYGYAGGAVAQLGTLDKDLTFRAKNAAHSWGFAADAAVIPLRVTQTKANTAFRVDQSANAQFAALFVGGDMGVKVQTGVSGGKTLTLTKLGDSGGEVLLIDNYGTGALVQAKTAGTVVFEIGANGLLKWTRSTVVQTTVGAAGAASPLPSAPTKYLKVVDDNGTTLVIPAYAAS